MRIFIQYSSCSGLIEKQFCCWLLNQVSCQGAKSVSGRKIFVFNICLKHIVMSFSGQNKIWWEQKFGVGAAPEYPLRGYGPELFNLVLC